MINKKMYQERKANIAAFRGCGFNCTYCAFQHTMSRSGCADCRAFKPHAHQEVLDRRPPPTKDGEFLTMGLNGDIAFASDIELMKMLLYCNIWDDRTFVLQTKDPYIFKDLTDFITPNMIIGTTLETDASRFWNEISQAPPPIARHAHMVELDCRKMVTVEPIMKFSCGLAEMIKDIEPEMVYIGYDSKNNHLPEPALAETQQLIQQLRDAGIDVREKLIRKAWDEQ